MKKISTSTWVILGLIVLAAVSRFLPHPAAFSPIAAIAIFGGAYITRKPIALLLPLIIMFITDSIIGFYPEMWGVYLPFVISGCLGFLLRKKVSVLKVGGICITSSIIFFVVSNFAVWLQGMCGYPMTMEGLIQCYVMGIPFFRNEAIGTLVYSGILFGAYEFAKSYIPALSSK